MGPLLCLINTVFRTVNSNHGVSNGAFLFIFAIDALYFFFSHEALLVLVVSRSLQDDGRRLKADAAQPCHDVVIKTAQEADIKKACSLYNQGRQRLPGLEAVNWFSPSQLV